MEVWSGTVFLLSTAAVFVIANVGALLAWLRADRALARVLAELDSRPGAVYPAVLIAHGYGQYDLAVTGWAAVHRARRAAPDSEPDHPLTTLARGVAQHHSSLEDITEVTGKDGFHRAHMAEAAWLKGRLPGHGDSIGLDFDLRAALMGFPAAAVAGWAGLYVGAYLTAGLAAQGTGLDQPYGAEAGAPYGGAVLAGLLVGVASFLVMLAVQALLWLRMHSRWQQRIRGRGAQVARHELGDSYDAFLADLSQDEAVIPRPRAGPGPAPGAASGRHGLTH